MNEEYGLRPVIALCGRNGAGKSTLAKALASNWATRDDLFIGPHLTKVMSFAEPLKDSLIAMLNVPRKLFYPETQQDRIDRETIYRPLVNIFNDSKMSARKLMLDYGAVMREAFGEQIWTQLAFYRMREFFTRHAVESPVVIFDDVRFEDEFNELYGCNALFVAVHVEGDDESNVDTKSVEWRWLKHAPDKTLHITTNHTEEALKRNVHEITKAANKKFRMFLPDYE